MRNLSVLALLLLSVPALTGCLEGVFPGPVTPEDLVSDRDYAAWVIEVDYVEGHQPSTQALNLLKTRMEGLVRKDTIDIRVDDSLPESGGTWSTSDIFALKDAYQDTHTGDGTVVTWMVYLDGHSDADSDDGAVLGAAFSDHETVAMFKQSMRDAAEASLQNPLPAYSAAEIERAVVVHEFGHILGLVNNGLPMVADHEADECNGDPDSGHSDNRDSVMYCAVESGNLIQAFNGGLPTTFDPDDRADVCAAGGKC